MRNLSFITRYSDLYRGPLVEIYIDDRPVAAAVPHDSQYGRDSEERGKVAGFSEAIVAELTKDEYSLFDYEIEAIIDYLTTEEFFREYFKKSA